MGPIVYVIAILACGDGQADCRAVRTARPVFTNATACALATRSVLEASTDVDAPLIAARCEPRAAEVTRAAGATPAG